MGATGSSLPQYDYDNPTNFTENVGNTLKWMKNDKLTNYNDWEKTITSDQQQAIYSFTGSGYKNSKFVELYNKPWDELTPTQQKYASDLYDTLSGFELKKPINVMRKASTKLFGMEGMTLSQLKALEGKIVHSNGFMSTAAATHGKYVDSNECEMKITIPKSVGAGAFVAYKSSVGSGEKEFLLNNNGFFKIEKVSKGADGKPFIEMKWIGRSKDQLFAGQTEGVTSDKGIMSSGNKGAVSTKTVSQTVKKKK